MRFDFSKMARTAFKIFSKHSQTVTGIGAVAGLTLTSYLIYNNTGDIQEILGERDSKIRELSKEDTTNEELKEKKREVDKETRKKLVSKVAPIVVSFTATAALMIGTVVISNIKIDNLTSMAAFSDLAYKELLQKTREEVGEEKAQDIQEKAEKAVEEKTTFDKTDVAKCGSRELYMDCLTKQTFWIDPVDLKKIIDFYNKQLEDGMCCDILLTHFYNKIAAKGNRHMYDIPIAEGYAWRSTTYKKVPIQLNDYNAIRTPEGAAIVMDFYDRPQFYEDLV